MTNRNIGFFINQDGKAIDIETFKWKYTISKEKGFDCINIVDDDGIIVDSFVVHKYT